MRSLRGQLLTSTIGVVLATLCMAALALYFLMRTSLLAEFDASLLVAARTLAAQVEWSDEGLHLEGSATTLPEFSRVKQPHFFQIWSGDGRTLARSPSLLEASLTTRSSESLEPSFAFATLPNGADGREVTLAFHPRREGGEDERRREDSESEANDESKSATDEEAVPLLTIVVARPIAELAQTLSTLRWLLLLVTVSAAGTVAVLMNGAIRRGLRPLETLAQSIAQVGVADLSERLQSTSSPAEVLPVVARLNELLARLDSALARERTFSADVAHELRTPLAGLETALEVCASRRREPDEYADVVAKCWQVTRDMHAMVNHLLLLARAESHALTVQTEPTDFHPFLDECWQPFTHRAVARSLHVEWSVPVESVIPLDRDKLRLILSNLFENAVSHTNTGGWVRIAAEIRGARLEHAEHVENVLHVSISNSGCVLNPADAEQVFDRFWRGDAARTDAVTHSGLGLALCQRIAAVLRGTTVATINDGTFSISLTLPVSIGG
jgi:signal transduction histidine kinase